MKLLEDCSANSNNDFNNETSFSNFNNQTITLQVFEQLKNCLIRYRTF